MVGSRTGVVYRLGDRVSVRLVEAAPVAGALRFELTSEGRRGEPVRRGRPERTRRLTGREPPKARALARRGKRPR
jgi:ribonuclease R